MDQCDDSHIILTYSNSINVFLKFAVGAFVSISNYVSEHKCVPSVTSMKCFFFLKKHLKFGRTMKNVYQVWNADFFSKKHVKFRRMIKICSIAFFSHFGEFVNTTPVEIVPFYCESFIEPFFHIFVGTEALVSKCVTHRCKQTEGVKSGEWAVWRRTSQLSASDMSRTGFAVCDVALSWRKMTLYCLFRYSGLYFMGTVQIDQLLLVTFSIHRFFKF